MATIESINPETTAQASSDQAHVVAAIDVGSNSVRMVIAEVLPDGQIDVLERLQRAVRLGQDAFRRGRLGGQSMRAAVNILQDYRQLLRLYHVERLRAVATSAVREASNSDTFLDRVFMATALNVEVIGTSEESRLTVSAVRRAVGDALDINCGVSLIADVGGGSTLLTQLDDGEIVTSHSLRLGSIRLQEWLSTGDEGPDRSAELLRHQVVNALKTAQSALPLMNVSSFVAVGGDARFAAREVGCATDSNELVTVSREDLDGLVRECAKHTPEELSRRHGLPFAEAETLNPALIIYQRLLQRTQAEQMIVSHVSMRDGLLLELARDVTGQQDDDLLRGVVHSAEVLAEHYQVDHRHARDVATLSMRLFDLLQPDHGLGAKERLLLRVAALLHEVGGFVSNRSHHKHSYYLIANSEIFGLNRDEIEIVAQVARYHRRSQPKPSHSEYMALPRHRRVLVNKLSAILRLADAMARGHDTTRSDLHFERQGDELIVTAADPGELLIEQRAIAAKGDLFEDVYGMKVRVEEG